MSLFRLDASIRVEGSHSRQIADIVEQEWLAEHPGDDVLRRHVGVEPVGATTWATAVSAAYVSEADRSADQVAAAAQAAREVDAMASADALLFAVPLYNFGVSQHFKAWADLVIADPRMGPGVTPATAGKPTVLVTVRGGSYAAGTPREGWDHATSWMQRILSDVWQVDLRVVESEFTLVGVNPALDQFTELAAEMRIKAEESAREHGRALAGALIH
jgi:FMN-dependent NADH-azoreductase